MFILDWACAGPAKHCGVGRRPGCSWKACLQQLRSMLVGADECSRDDNDCVSRHLAFRRTNHAIILDGRGLIERPSSKNLSASSFVLACTTQSGTGEGSDTFMPEPSISAAKAIIFTDLIMLLPFYSELRLVSQLLSDADSAQSQRSTVTRAPNGRHRTDHHPVRVGPSTPELWKPLLKRNPCRAPVPRR